MKIKYHAKITYTIDKDHPDRKYVPDWTEEKQLTFEDVYTFTMEDYTKEDRINYMQRDLMLVAGGGYNTDHIHNVKFEIKQV